MTPTTRRTIRRDEALTCVATALRNAGACERVAGLLAHAAVFAEDQGKGALGLQHVLDYLHALEAGRMSGCAEPRLDRRAPGVLSCDARGGPFHTGFDAAFDDLVATARQLGTVVFLQSDAYAGGQLGWFTEALAREGLAAIATVNSSPLLAPHPGVGPILGTNPIAYSFPRADDQILTVDQSSSATAYVKVRDAAEHGEPLPAGWAVDASGQPTTTAADALSGALLPFGGYRGANIAWLAELLATLSGAQWSADAAPFDSGDACPSVGMFVLAIDVGTLGRDHPARLDAHLRRVAGLGARTPGRARTEPLEAFEVSAQVLDELLRWAGSAHGPD